jgi:hypothetical protein
VVFIWLICGVYFQFIRNYFHDKIWYQHIKFGVTTVDTPVKPDLRVMESMSTEISENITTTGPKRLVYTKKTE